MDYLGISITAPSPAPSDILDQSQTGSQLLEPAEPLVTTGSANMGARTWSKPSIPDSASQPVTTIPYKAVSPMPTSRGVVVRFFTLGQFLVFLSFNKN